MERKADVAEDVEEAKEGEKSALDRFRDIAESSAREAVAAARNLMAESDRRISSMVSDAMRGGADASVVKRATDAARDATDALVGLQNKFRRFMPVLFALGLSGQIERMGHPQVDVSFASREAAADQLRETGLTPERANAYTPGVSESVYRAINPHASVDDMSSVIEQIPRNFVMGRETTVGWDGEQMNLADYPIAEDAFRMYLGLPQQHDTFGVSDYQPKNSEDKYYYKINGWMGRYGSQIDDGLPNFHPMEEIVRTIEEGDAYRSERIAVAEQTRERLEEKKQEAVAEYERTHQDLKQSNYSEYVSQMIRTYRPIEDAILAIHVPEKTRWLDSKGSGFVIAMDSRATEEMVLPGEVAGNDVMTHFKISIGKDDKGEYISYYDDWDIGKPHGPKYLVEQVGGILGADYEIYDRIYFDRATWSVSE